SSRSCDSRSRSSGGYPCCSRITAALTAASKQCAFFRFTTSRNERIVVPFSSHWYGTRLKKRCTFAGVLSCCTSFHSLAVKTFLSGIILKSVNFVWQCDKSLNLHLPESTANVRLNR